jgi:hypothetical protein
LASPAPVRARFGRLGPGHFERGKGQGDELRDSAIMLFTIMNILG